LAVIPDKRSLAPSEPALSKVEGNRGEPREAASPERSRRVAVIATQSPRVWLASPSNCTTTLFVLESGPDHGSHCPRRTLARLSGISRM